MGLRAALASTMSDSACELLGDGASFAAIVGLASTTVAPELAIPAGVAALGMGTAYGLFCDRPSPSLTSPNTFTGGQCAGFEYAIVTRQDFTSNTRPSGTQGQTNSGIAPITVVRFDVDAQNKNKTTLTITDANSTRVIPVNPAASDDGTNPTYNYSNFTYDVHKQNGGVDNCGNPPPIPVIPNPNPIVDDRDVTYVTNNGDNITNNYGFTFSPAFIDFNGQLNVPVTINNNTNPGELIQATINFNNGQINFYAGDPAAPKGSGKNSAKDYKPGNNLPIVPPNVPIIPAPPIPTGDPPEKQEIIRAAIVTVSLTPNNISLIYQTDNPTIYAPNLGYINFLVQVGNATAWTSDIAVKNAVNFIPLDWEAGAIDVRGTPRPGVEWTITPIYVAQTVQ